MAQKKRPFFRFMRANPFLAALCVAQCLALLAFCGQLFKAPTTIKVDLAGVHLLDQAGNEGEKAQASPLVLEGLETGGFLSDNYALPGGAYTLTVDYRSEGETSKTGDYTGTLTAHSISNQAALTGDPTILNDGRTRATSRIWVAPWGRVRDLELRLSYTGAGRLAISAITLQEQVIWRGVVLIAALALFLLMDLVYALFFAKKAERLTAYAYRHRFEGCLLAVALLASLPALQNVSFWGHDQAFHCSRIGAVAAEMAMGRFPPRMLTTMLNGYGYPSSLFYCDLFLYLPALLYNCMLPLTTCYHIYVVLTNLIACAVAYGCFYKITGSQTAGVMGSALYTLAFYRLIDLYTRAAVGEYTAMTFLPLIALGLWTIYTKPDGERLTLREYSPLALGMAGIILCHALTLEMIAPFLVGVCLAMAKKTFQPKRLWAILKAIGIALLLGLWFFGPFIESMSGMNVMINEVYKRRKIQNTGLYPVQLINLFPAAFGGGGESIAGDMGLSVGWLLAAGAPLAAYLLIQRSRWQLEDNADFKLLRMGCLVSAAAMGLTLYFIPWDSVEGWFGKTVEYYTSMIQFSWRYLSVATFGLTVVWVAAFKLLERPRGERLRRAALYLAVGALLVSTGYYYSSLITNSGLLTYHDYTSKPQAFDDCVSSGEYLLAGVEMSFMDEYRVEADSAALVTGDLAADAQGVTVVCHNGGERARLTLPIFFYQHYHVYDLATGQEMAAEAGDNQRIAVSLPAGFDGAIQVRYIPPVRWRVYEGVSLAALIALIYGLWRGRRKIKAQGAL